jgi:hypothetical protein
LTANLRDPIKPKILPTFDVRHPVDSIPTIALTYLKKYKEDINLKIWNKAIINLINANKQGLNRFLLHYIVYYKDSKYNNTAL